MGVPARACHGVRLIYLGKTRQINRIWREFPVWDAFPADLLIGRVTPPRSRYHSTQRKGDESGEKEKKEAYTV